MEIRPIQSESDYEAALSNIEKLMDAEPDTPEGNQLDVLVTLVEAYEQRHFPIEAPDPIEAIKFRMEQKGYRQSDLGELLGSQPRASEVLRKRRRLTLDMIHRLNSAWGIPAEVLITPYALAGQANAST